MLRGLGGGLLTMSPSHAGDKVSSPRLYCIRRSGMRSQRTMKLPATEGSPPEETARLRMPKRRQCSPMLAIGAAGSPERRSVSEPLATTRCERRCVGATRISESHSTSCGKIIRLDGTVAMVRGGSSSTPSSTSGGGGSRRRMLDSSWPRGSRSSS
ncbi:hypothetical protein SEVIR_5G102001v4 [Setaria viridis]